MYASSVNGEASRRVSRRCGDWVNENCPSSGRINNTEHRHWFLPRYAVSPTVLHHAMELICVAFVEHAWDMKIPGYILENKVAVTNVNGTNTEGAY